MGGFFPADVHRPGEAAPPRWRSLRSLLDNPAALDARVEFVRVTLSAGGLEVPARVAGSVVQLGMSGRILAPALAAQALGLQSVSLHAADLWCQDDLGGAYPLSLTTAAVTDLVEGVIVELADLFARRYGVPSRTIWGNLASTINSAARQFTLARPDLAAAARAVADHALADARLDGGRLRVGPAFRRRSCCLIYQASGSRAAVCGDCVLAAAGHEG